jgi:hypothetical protein
MMLRTVLLFLSLLSVTFSVERFVGDGFIREDVDRPLEIVVGDLTWVYQDFHKALRDGRDLGEIKEKEFSYLQTYERVYEHIVQENLIEKFASYFESSDPLTQASLAALAKNLISRENLRLQAGASSVSVTSAASLFPSLNTRVSYEYAYGEELEREVQDEFEAIHRYTYMENREHNVDIDVDFLEPIKKIVEKLSLKDKFKWLWEQKLHFGYHSSFFHRKKVFMRSVGYYQKVAVTLQVLRREKKWWGGSGEWELHGTAVRYFEEPRAIVATEAKELD